ncbi:MAG: glycosyltransferase [Gemmataceae bacterium]
MRIAHLAASPFFGGPERQMLGLGLALPEEFRSLYLSFAERGLARPFLDELSHHGLETVELKENVPRLAACIAEVAATLRDFRVDILFCHSYKADLIGWRAARRLGIPVVAVSRGWTAASLKVRCYEWLDRACLFAMDGVVCVSEGQAKKVRRLGLPRPRVHVIRNSIDVRRFAKRDPFARAELERLFTAPKRLLIGAAGRFSPEKGFPVLVEAAADVCRRHPDAAFILFGDGPERGRMERRLRERDLNERVLLPGFRADLDRILPAFDVVVLPSFTEGLPNIALEASAAGVPVVATAVGGTPEVVIDGVTGLLAPAGDSAALAAQIIRLLDNEAQRGQMGAAGRAKMAAEFSFESQAAAYVDLTLELAGKSRQRRRKAPGYRSAPSL